MAKTKRALGVNPPSKTCAGCSVELQAHAAWMSKTRDWQWRYGSDTCYRCRRGGAVVNTPNRCAPRLYAVWFGPVRLMKIGKTSQAQDYSAVWNACQKAKRKDGKLIWTQPGDYPEEAFMQAYFSLRGYLRPSGYFGGTRVSEWLHCPDDTKDTLIQKLDAIYEYIRKIKAHDGL